LDRFPVFLGGDTGPGSFFQAQAEFDASGGLRIIRGPGEDFTAEFLEESLVRVKAADSYYFVLLEDGPQGFCETWYDPAGSALFSIISEYPGGENLRVSFQDEAAGTPPAETKYYYDSAGSLTGISSPGGEWSALYDVLGRPRYWERRPSAGGEASSGSDAGGRTAPGGPGESPGNYTFQWDERGLLVRFYGGPPGETENGVDYRYEYTLDERGNWIERRETGMVPRSGRLVPVPGRTVRRRISYAPVQAEEAAESATAETAGGEAP
jgi:YD repeat-containing protein